MMRSTLWKLALTFAFQEPFNLRAAPAAGYVFTASEIFVFYHISVFMVYKLNIFDNHVEARRRRRSFWIFFSHP